MIALTIELIIAFVYSFVCVSFVAAGLPLLPAVIITGICYYGWYYQTMYLGDYE